MWYMDKTNILKKDNKWTYFSSIVFLICIVVFTFLLYFYNNILDREINDIKTKISLREQEINDLEKDKEIQIYALLDKNQEIVKKLSKISQVTKFINHLDETSEVYNLTFKWFNLSNWKLKTIWLWENDDNWIAYKKISSFIKRYRNDNNTLFNLWFINWIKWIDSIKFNLDFDIK